MALSNSELLRHLREHSEGCLDDAVADCIAKKGSKINNEGHMRQTTFLRREGLSNEKILEVAGGEVPQNVTTILTLEIEFDSSLTDADAVGVAVDRLLEAAMSMPNVLSEYGNPRIGQTCVQFEWVRNVATYAMNIVPFSQMNRIVWLRFLAKEILASVGDG